MEIVRHVHGTSLAFDRLMESNEVIGSWEKGSNRFINHGDLGQQTLPPARFGPLFPKKMLHEFRSFLTNWRPLTANLSELLVSNWRGLVPMVKQFNRAKEVFDIRCRYVDNTSRTWYLAEDRRFLWKGGFAGMINLGCCSNSLRVIRSYG